MISLRRLEANRRNALRSTGPRTEAGKQRSRANAVRHGLTTETVVANLEDAEDYKAFEAAIIADYDPETAVARELVLRLASLLWRLRRANAIETNLLEIQADAIGDCGLAATSRTQELDSPGYIAHRPINASNEVEDLGGASLSVSEKIDDALHCRGVERPAIDYKATTRQLTYCFLRLAKLDSGVFERLSRYEAALWRQTIQTLLALHPIRHR